MEYVGGELELFACASNWKSYLASQMMPYIRGRVLEVGAGIGSNIPILFKGTVTHWLALEPDHRLADAIRDSLNQGKFPDGVTVEAGMLAQLPDHEVFDTILYVDVLEHILGDHDEISRAARHLAPGGHLIVLSPAHQFLFCPFDESVGHVRRYDRRSLTGLTPARCEVASVRMLDCAGFFLSLGNRMLMKSSMPTPGQIKLWDSLFVPLSRLLDRLTLFRFGKSILMVWRTKAPIE